MPTSVSVLTILYNLSFVSSVESLTMPITIAYNIRAHIKNDMIDLKIVAKMIYCRPLYNNNVGKVVTGEVVN